MIRMLGGLALLGLVCAAAEPRAVRIGTGPILTPASEAGIGTNLNGPSLIRVPGWVERPLGILSLLCCT